MRWTATALILLTAGTITATAEEAKSFYNIKLGDTVEDVKLSRVGGGKVSLRPGGKVSVFIFFRADKDNSRAAIAEVAKIAKKHDGKAIHWIAIAADASQASDVRALAAETGLEIPVAIDRGDALYGKIGVMLHPSVGVTDAQGKLTAYLPYTAVSYGDRIEAYALHALGELDDAGLKEVLNPKAAKLGGDEAVAKRNLKLAGMLYAAKKYEKALGLTQKAVEAGPGMADTHGLLAAIYARMEKCGDAKGPLAKALELDAKNEYAKEAQAACDGK